MPEHFLGCLCLCCTHHQIVGAIKKQFKQARLDARFSSLLTANTSPSVQLYLSRIFPLLSSFSSRSCSIRFQIVARWNQPGLVCSSLLTANEFPGEFLSSPRDKEKRSQSKKVFWGVDSIWCKPPIHRPDWSEFLIAGTCFSTDKKRERSFHFPKN